ncbi:hypothetical protein Tco_1562472 [Tanacetum coccineum]
MVFNSPCLTDKKELIHHEVEMVINSPWIMPLLGTKGLASPEQTATVGLFNKATKTANYMVLEGVLMKNKDAASSRDIQLICAEFSSIQVKTQADWMLLQSSYFNPQVPTGRVVVPTGRYVVLAGKVIIKVSPGRLSLVPTGRVLSPGSDNESDDASIHNEATIAQQQQNIRPQIITTVSNNNAKFPYLKKDEYEVWAIKMEYWITNNDMNIWKVIQNGNSLKRTGRDHDERVIILPPTTADEHIAIQRESKARTTLLQSIPDDHVADFHYMDDARDIWNAVKARFGGNAKSKKMRKSMLKQEFSEFRISKAEGLHKGRWDLKWQLAMLSVRVHKFEQKAGRKTDFDKKESVRFNKKKDIGKKEEDSKALITVDTLVDWTEHDGQSDGVIAPKVFGMIVGCDTEDAIEEGAAKIYNLITGADTKEASTVGDDGEFALMGVTSEPKSNDSTSCASTSSVSTSESEAEIESNVGTPIQEPIIVQDLPSHFRKNDSSVLKLWFCIVVSSTHLIKDCDFYEIQIWLNKTGKVYIPPARPHPVPTGNMERLDDFQEFQGGKVTFRGGEGRITRKGTIRTPTLDFENVYYVKELQQFNLTSTLPNEVLVVLRVPRKHTHLHLNLNNLSPRLVVKSIQYVFGLEHAIEATSSLDVITLQIWITPVFSSTASMIFCFNDYVQALTSAHFISRLGLLLALRVAIRPRRQDSCNDSGMTMNLGRTIDKQFHGLNAIIEKGGYVECEALSYFSMYMALLNARAVVLLYAYKKYNVSRVDVRSLDVYKFTMTFAYWSSYEDVINDNMQGACQAYDRHVNSKVDPLIGKSVDLLETHLLDLGPYGYSQPSRPMSRLFQNGSTTLDIIRGYANIAGVSAVGNLPDLQRHDMFVTTMVEEWWQAPSCLSSCTYGVYFASRSTKGYSGYDSLVDTIESSQDSPAFHSDLHLIWIRELLKSLTATRSERGGEKSELGGLCMM